MKKKVVKEIIRNNKILAIIFIPIYRGIKSILLIPKEYILYKKTKNILSRVSKEQSKIFYLGIPAHANLGDLAQGVCIRNWIKKHYNNRQVVEIETNAIVNTHFSVLNLIIKEFNNDDLIVFQSGYTTTDLGGFADDMHCAIMKALPEAKMLMMPQTIYFESEVRKKNTADVYNSVKNLLFLARDRISYGIAKEMFPNINVVQFPDIVTTMIGKRISEQKRDGILFCVRDDCEKFYSEKELRKLMDNCSKFSTIKITDTTKTVGEKEIIERAEYFVNKEIEYYSRFKLIITDRYHGTIFSLIARTPVIIIKTKDHKVITGVEWFKGVYDDYVYYANSLEEAYSLAKLIYYKNISYKIEPYFEKKYYDKLLSILNDFHVDN